MSVAELRASKIALFYFNLLLPYLFCLSGNFFSKEVFYLIRNNCFLYGSDGLLRDTLEDYHKRKKLKKKGLRDCWRCDG